MEFWNDCSKHWPFIMLLHRNGLLNFRDLCTVQLYQKYWLTIHTFVIRYTVAAAQWNVSVSKSWICYCRCCCSFYIFLFRYRTIWEECTIVIHSPLLGSLFSSSLSRVYMSEYKFNVPMAVHCSVTRLRVNSQISRRLRFCDIIHLSKPSHNHMAYANSNINFFFIRTDEIE